MKNRVTYYICVSLALGFIFILSDSANSQNSVGSYLKAQIDYEVCGVKKSAYEQEGLRNRGTDKFEQYMKQSAEYAKKQGKAYEILVKGANFDKIAQHPSFGSKKECQDYRKSIQQQLNEYYTQERTLDQQRPYSHIDSFEKMHKYIPWVNKLWPIKYKMIPLYKRKLELCNCDALIFRKYDHLGRMILKSNDFANVHFIGEIRVEHGEVYFDKNSNTVYVPKGAKATFTYDSDNTLFNLKEDSEVTLSSDHQLYIRYGSLGFRVHKKGQEFIIKTPSAIAGCFSREGYHRHHPPLNQTNETIVMDVESRNGTDHFYVYQGEVLIKNNASRKLLRAGEMTTSRNINDQLITLNFDPNNKSITWPKNQTSKTSNSSYSSTTNHVVSNSSSPEFFTLLKTSAHPKELEQNISHAVNAGKTPVGLFMNENQDSYICFINDNPLAMTAWTLQWYNDANSLQSGITQWMNNGYVPMGISFTDQGKLYAIFIQCQVQGTAWQLVESNMDLNSVSNDLQPYIQQDYIPFGISVYQGKYYTLMVQATDTGLKSWTIEGYAFNQDIITQNINQKATEGMIPFGYLKKDDVVNVLYVGYNRNHIKKSMR